MKLNILENPFQFLIYLHLIKQRELNELELELFTIYEEKKKENQKKLFLLMNL